MTPAKRRPATPASQRPTRAAPAPDAKKDSTQEGLEAEPEPTEPETGVLGPDRRPLTRPAPETKGPTEDELAANEEAPTGDASTELAQQFRARAKAILDREAVIADTSGQMLTGLGGDSAPPTETGQVDPDATPTVEAPAVREPVVETPAAAAPVVEGLAVKVPEAHAPTGSEPVPQEPAVREAAAGEPAVAEARAPGRSRALHPGRVWPD